MTRPATSSPDRGLQSERTVLAWTRTSLSVVVSAVLVLLKDHSVADLSGGAARLGIGGVAAAVALAVFAVGVLRRRALEVRPLPEQVRAQRTVLLVGILVVALTLLLGTYLVLGA